MSLQFGLCLWLKPTKHLEYIVRYVHLSVNCETRYNDRRFSLFYGFLKRVSRLAGRNESEPVSSGVLKLTLLC